VGFCLGSGPPRFEDGGIRRHSANEKERRDRGDFLVSIDLLGGTAKRDVRGTLMPERIPGK